MKTLNNFKFDGKTVLLRADLNSDVVNGKVLLGERIKGSLETIKELKKKKARIVIIAHQGQPGKSDFLSLKQHSKLLNNFVKVKFINDILGKKAVKAIEDLKPGEIILLENIRFENDEFEPEKKDNKLLKLVNLFDIYVNDAFSVCHRNHTSLVGFAKILPSCAGRLLEKEINALKKINIKNCLYILGGAKPGDYLSLMRGQKILACGLFGQSCLIARGKELGAQEKYLEKEAGLDEELKKKLKIRLKNVLMPEDFAVKINRKREEIPVDVFPSKYEIFDIGSRTIEKYSEEIKKAKAIYMKGPVGYSVDKKFAKGTNAILRAISENKGFSLIGGGHLSDAIKKSGINKKKFSHISLSGGALLRYVAGEKLPGLDALNI